MDVLHRHARALCDGIGPARRARCPRIAALGLIGDLHTVAGDVLTYRSLVYSDPGFGHYERQAEGLGARFLAAVDSVFDDQALSADADIRCRMTPRRRRQVLFASCGLFGGLVFPRVLRSQGRTARIGLLTSASRGTTRAKHLWEALSALGWVEGRNLRLYERYADGDLTRHDALAAELVALGLDLIVAPTQPAAVAAMKATRSIPIVFILVPEPVESGLVASLARPGKNATGLATVNKDLVAKRVQLMQEALPALRRIVLLYQPEFDMNQRQAALAEATARLLGLDVARVGIGLPPTFDAAFAELARYRSDAVLVIENPAVFTHRAEIVRRMAQRKIVAMYGFQEFVLAGGLISYSINFPDQFRRAASYVDRILRGAHPSDLPVEQPLKFELTVNLGAARTLGISIPASVVQRADKVIE